MINFDRLFEDNKDFIFKFLLKLCKDIPLAEELMQETFYKAYINIGGLKNPDKAPSWLCSIARNTYFSWFNEQKRRISFDEEFSDALVVDNYAELLEEKELTKEAFRCLESLDEPYKEVFKLSVFGRLSLKEISTLFDKSESWARVTFYRAKLKILEKMR